MPTTSIESSLQVLVKKPKASDSVGKGKDKRTKQGEVLPADRRELEATSSGQSTESEEGGAGLASSSTTPWQRRVRLRTALEAKDKNREPCPVAGGGDVGMAEASEHPTRPSCSQGGGAPELHGWQQSGVSKSLLKAMPKTLGFEWCPRGPCGTVLQWLAKGQDRAAHTCQGMVFKISELPQLPELRLSRRFPGVVAKVFWTEEIVLVLHGLDTATRFPMTLLCQEQCTPAVTILKDRGENFAFRFATLHASSRGYGTTGSHSWNWGRQTWESRWTLLTPLSPSFVSLTLSPGVKNSAARDSIILRLKLAQLAQSG